MITFVTSLYHSEQYLPQFLRCVSYFSSKLEKEKIPFEFIFILNDSSNEEKEIINIFGIPSWLRIIEVKRESLYASWNRGVRESRGNLISFWNVDDTRFAEAVKEGIELINEGADLVYFPFTYKRYVRISSIRILAKRYKVQPPLFDAKRFNHEMHIGPFFIFKKSFFEKVGAFDESFKIAGDFDWAVRASKKEKAHFVLGKEIAGQFISEGRGLSTTGTSLHEQENKRILGI